MSPSPVLLLCCLALAWTTASGQRRHAAGRRLREDDSGPLCYTSSLGYQCSRRVCASITLHWSLGGAAPPGSSCTYLSNDTSAAAKPSAGALDSEADVMHFALQTDYSGYVAMSWPQRQGFMSPADGVIGWMDAAKGVASVDAYFIKAMSSNPASAVEVDSKVGLHHTAAVLGAHGLTTCFSRDRADVGKAKISVSLLAAMPMNFVACTTPGLGIHASDFDTGHLCSPAVTLVAGRTSGTDQDAHFDDEEEGGVWASYVTVHGVTMILVWAVLIPAGILCARHKQMLAFRGPSAWFQMHRAVQGTASVLFAFAFVLPFYTFTKDMDLGSEGGVMKAHAAFAILLAVGLFLHLTAAFFRPKPEHRSRGSWNRLHWWSGRIMPLVALLNIFIGIAINVDEHGASAGRWLGALLPWLVALIAMVVWLERQQTAARGRDKASFGGADPEQELSSLLAGTTGFSALGTVPPPGSGMRGATR